MKTYPVIVRKTGATTVLNNAAVAGATPAGLFRKIHNLIPHGWHASVYSTIPLVIPAAAYGGTTGMEAVRIGALLATGAGMPVAAAITKGALPTQRAGAKLGVHVTTNAEAMLPLKRLSKFLLPVMGASLLGGMIWSRFLSDDSSSSTSTMTPAGNR